PFMAPRPLQPFSSLFTTAQALKADSLPPGTLTVSFPDAAGLSNVTGGAGLVIPRTAVVLVNERTGATVTVMANDDGSFSGTISAQLGDKISVQMKDRLGNVTTLKTGNMRRADGAVAVGPEGGVVEGPGGVRAVFEEGSFDGYVPVKLTPRAADQVLVPTDPNLLFLAGANLDLGGAVSKKEIHLSWPVPVADPPFTPDDQFLVGQVVTVPFPGPSDPPRHFLTLADKAVFENGRIRTASPPFPGIWTMGDIYLYAGRQIGCIAYGIIESLYTGYDTATLGAMSALYGFGPIIPGGVSSRFVVPLPCNRTVELTVTDPGGNIERVTITGPEKGQFVEKKITNDHDPPVVKFFSIPDASEGVFYDRALEIVFDERIDPGTVNAQTVRVVTDGGGAVVGERVVHPSRVKATFVPRHGWPVNETITVEVTGLKDDMDNVMDRVYRTSFKTYAPRVLATVVDEFDKPIEGVLDLDYFSNTVIAAGKMSNGLDGIVTVDVSDPASPRKISELYVPGHARTVRTVRDARITARDGKLHAGDFALVGSWYGSEDPYAYFSLLGLNGRSAPVRLGQMIVAKNISDFPSPSSFPVYEHHGFPWDVADVGKEYAYAAVVGLGLQMYPIGWLPYAGSIAWGVATGEGPGASQSPLGLGERPKVNQQLPVAMLQDESYRRLSGVGGRLLALRGNNTLDLLAPGLSLLSSDERMGLLYNVRGVEAFPVDLDKDGSIAPEEAIDLSVTSQRGGVVVHRVTSDGRLDRLTFVSLTRGDNNPAGGGLCVDRRRRLAYVGGTSPATGETGLFVVSLYDLPLPEEYAARLSAEARKNLPRYPKRVEDPLYDADKDGDGQDDRVIGFIPGAGGCNAVNDDATVGYSIQGGVQTVRLAPDPLEIWHIDYKGAEKAASGSIRRYNGLRESEYFLAAVDFAEPAHAYLKSNGYKFTVKVEVKDKKTGSVIGAETVTLSSPDPSAQDGKGGCPYGGVKCDYRSVEKEGKWSGTDLLVLTDVLDDYEYNELRDEGRRYEERRSQKWPEAAGWDAGNDPYKGYTRKPLRVGIGPREVVLTVMEGGSASGKLWELMMGRKPGEPQAPKLCAVERAEVVVLGIDGLRQDVLYSANDVNVPSDGVYTEPMGLTGVGQALGRRLERLVDYDEPFIYQPVALTGEMEKKHVKLRGVVSVFPSITLASWASIFTGKLPGRTLDAGGNDAGHTGQLGNEFFARDLLGQPGVPDTTQQEAEEGWVDWALGWAGQKLGLKKVTNPSGMVSYSSGSFPGFDALGSFLGLLPGTLWADFVPPMRGSIDQGVGTDWSRAPDRDNRWGAQNRRELLTAPTVYEQLLDPAGVRSRAGRTVVQSNHYARGADLWLTHFSNLVGNIDALGAGATESALMDGMSYSTTRKWLKEHQARLAKGEESFPGLFVYYTAGLDHDAHDKGVATGEVYKKFFQQTTDGYAIANFVDKLKEL
ncbi:MAG: Ig-like domain-containing protein, partial [Nitrospirae bacterium]|nr:Ig-like domain-containing protein [Nitrospirota bacterium]